MTGSVTPADPVGAIALLDEPKRRQLYEFVVASHGPVGRDAAAAAVGLSRELVAFHLDRLVAGGLLETEYKRLGTRRGPGAGRPAKLYRLADRDLEASFPQRDYGRAADILAEALEWVDAGSGVSGHEALADAARARGTDAGLEARRRAGARPTHRQLRTALLDLLKRAGYVPEIARADERICLRNCPYDALASGHRELTCGMNVAWAQGVVEGLGDPGLAASFTPPDGSCCVAFEGTAARPRIRAASGSDPAS